MNCWHRNAFAVACVMGLFAGCSGSSSAANPVPLHAAPEPATAPVPAQNPAGTVVALPAGSQPEGAVFDPGSGLVAVGLRHPDRLGLVNPVARTVTTVSVDASARHLDMAAPYKLLVPGEDSNVVLTVALPGGNVTASVSVPKQPHDVAALSPTDFYVADEFGPSVTHVVDGKIVKIFGDKLQPGGAGVAGQTAAVVDVRARLTWFYRDGKQIGHLPAGAGPTHAMGISNDRIVVSDTTGGALLVYNVSGKPKPAATTALSGQPYGLAYDGVRNRLWVTRTGVNELVRYDVTAAGLRRSGAYPTVQDAYSVAVDTRTGTVLVFGEKRAQVQILSP